MKKLLKALLVLGLMTNCSYFQVRTAIKEADRGNYISSLNNLKGILSENPEDRRALDAFELIYPNAEKRYYDEIDGNKNYDLLNYTKSMYRLLQIENLYYDLPEVSKNLIALIKPPVNERNEIKIRLADGFYDLGTKLETKNYIDRLKKYAYLSMAQGYNLKNLKNISQEYEKSKNNAIGKFHIVYENLINMDSNFIGEIEKTVKKYKLFQVSYGNSANIVLDIKMDKLEYAPPTLKVVEGVDSYYDTVYKTVVKTENVIKIINGKEVVVPQKVKVKIPVEIEIFFRYKKYTRFTKLSYNLDYKVKEKNDKIIDENQRNMTTVDENSWIICEPLTYVYPGYVYQFSDRGMDRNLKTKEELLNENNKKSVKLIDEMLEKLHSNSMIQW